jgi:hypothetical protein
LRCTLSLCERHGSRLAKNSALKLKKNQTKFNFLFFNSHLRIITQSPVLENHNVTSTLNFRKIFRSYKCPARFIFTLPVLSYSAVATAIWQPCVRGTVQCRPGRYGKESRLLLVAFPSASPIGGERSDVSTLYSYVV